MTQNMSMMIMTMMILTSQVRIDMEALQEDRHKLLDEVLAASEETAEVRARELQESVRLVAKAVVSISEKCNLSPPPSPGRVGRYIGEEGGMEGSLELSDDQSEATSPFDKIRCSPRILIRGLYDQPSVGSMLISNGAEATILYRLQVCCDDDEIRHYHFIASYCLLSTLVLSTGLRTGHRDCAVWGRFHRPRTVGDGEGGAQAAGRPRSRARGHSHE